RRRGCVRRDGRVKGLRVRTIRRTYHVFYWRLDNGPIAIIMVTIGDKEMAMQTVTTSPSNPSPAPSMPGVPAGLPADLASLSSVQRWKLAIGLLRKVLNNPEDTEQVLAFLGVINSGRSTQARVERFFADPDGQALYAAHRAIDSRTVDLDALAALPEGT